MTERYQMSHRFTRRRFLVTVGATASTMLGSSIFNVDSVWAAPLVRRNLGGMAPDDPILISYRKAIKAMKALPASNPLSWDYQAAIYGTALSADHKAWNTRQLGNHFFWTWHRMYLYWFERIVRKMSDNPAWALPFWDYESPAQRALPPAFRDPNSELCTPNRGTSWNEGSASFPACHVDSSYGMAIGGAGLQGRAFFTAGEVIESNPHNNVHVDIGGLMGSPLTAALDPVFYVHTANIDRLWNLWLGQGGSMRNDPLFLDVWKNNSYTFFDENGREVHMTGCDVMRCAEQLNYTYEGEPPQVNQYCPRPLRALSTEVRLLVEGPSARLTGQPGSVPIDLAPILQWLPKLLQNTDSFVALNFQLQAEREPGAVWEVYLGLPPDAPASSDSRSFLGTASLFSRGILSYSTEPGSNAVSSSLGFLFPAAPALRAVIKSKQSRVLVRFVPSGPLIEGKPSQPRVQGTVRCGPVNLALVSFKEPD
jgi:hypothetical protein